MFSVLSYLLYVNVVFQVLITLCELLGDQLKTHRKTPSGSQRSFNTLSMDDLIAFLDGPHAEGKECSICVVIHNIDGPGLRDSDSQQYLARIAACSHVHMVASIDNVNAPLCKCNENYCNFHMCATVLSFSLFY